jgi:CheY-like chemotaxis protein
MLHDLLRLWGHEVDAAADGLTGLEKIKAVRPDVALVDVGLPGMNGYQIAQAVRATARGGKIRLIALTGYGQPADRTRAVEAGFDAHLVKPVDVQELSRMLEADA